MSDLTITESSGTALSLLHASGEIRDLHIEGAGRLGVLATRSIVTIRGGRIERVRTTAIEAGDRSRVEVEKLAIVDASIGMAAKNGARGRLLGSTLRGIVHVPLLAFSDRPELGGGELVADGNTFDVPDNGRRALAQRSSRVLLDGVAVAEVDADIGELRID